MNKKIGKCFHIWEEISEGFELVGGNLWEKIEYRCVKCGKTERQISKNEGVRKNEQIRNHK